MDTVQEGRSTVRTRQRLLEGAVRRENYGWPLHFVEDHSAFSFSGGVEVGRDTEAPETSVFRSGDTMAGMGGVKEEAGTAVASR